MKNSKHLEHTRCTIHCGDSLTVLKTLPDESVQCCVTSPPYWGLRDYGADGQLGLESTPEEYAEKMVALFREVRRVLRDDGTLWLNLGDSYASHDPGGYRPGEFLNPDGKQSDASIGQRNRAGNYKPVGLKPKDLIGIPWRVAFALQADGWYLRSDIIWHKPNPMPESVTDRPTKSHEYVFLLTKSAKYYYDAEAIRESFADDRMGRDGGTAPSQRNRGGRTDGLTKPSGIDPSLNGGRNKRSVWTVTTKSYAGAHFATFPPDLIRPCILAGTSEQGCCAECGAPWERVVEKESSWAARRDAGAIRGNVAFGGNKGAGTQRSVHGNHVSHDLGGSSTTTGWQPTCDGGPVVPCTVLDPFMGSGTTAQVALEQGRHALGIELNPEYCDLITRRLNPILEQELLFDA